MDLELEQRAILFSVWERGLLKDSKNYKAVKDITGLNDKEIDRWVKFQESGSSNLNIPESTTSPEMYLDLSKI